MNEAAAPGVKLKAERERRGLSAQKAADEMHLDRWVIDALEAGDYARIGPAVYAKGHLKKYAALLGLPAAEIAAGFESHAPAPAAVSAGPSMLLSTRDESGSSGGLTPLQVAGCVAVVLALGILWWRPWHARAKAPVSAPPAASAAVSAAPAATPETGILSSALAAPVAVAAAPIPAATTAAGTAGGTAGSTAATSSNASTATSRAAPDSPAVSPDPAAPVPGTGRARLRLSFSADSWVDVHDAAGKRTFAGNGLANSVKTISGLAPMRVYLGVGSGVQLEINDRAVAIGPQFFAGDVARFEAGADGVLRRDSRGDSSHPDQSRGAAQRNPRPPG
jgi:cytoskeleton protein RodZ